MLLLSDSGLEEGKWLPLCGEEGSGRSQVDFDLLELTCVCDGELEVYGPERCLIRGSWVAGVAVSLGGVYRSMAHLSSI